MDMTEVEIMSIVAAIGLIGALFVRLWAAFAQGEDMSEASMPIDMGISQTTGNQELQADRAQVQPSLAGVLAVIADGIGRKNIGQICAQIAVDTLLDKYEPYAVLNEPDYFFRTAFREAHRRIQMTLEDHRGGTSLGAVFADEVHLYYALVGNIRIALFRSGELIPLSKGQTLDILAEEAWKDGKISRQEVLWSLEEHRIWNYLGMDGFHNIEIGMQPIQTRFGDVVFLATCGIFEELSWSEIEDILVGSGTLQDKAERIVYMAERKKELQKENGSVILLRMPYGEEGFGQFGGMK